MANGWISAGSDYGLRIVIGVLLCLASLAQGAPPAPNAVAEAEYRQGRAHYAERDYAFIYETVKGLGPNQLYFGLWSGPGWGENDEGGRVSWR